MLAEFECELQFSADTIGACHQYWVTVFFGDFEQRPKTADPGKHLWAHGALSVGLDIFHQAIPGIDVYTSISI